MDIRFLNYLHPYVQAWAAYPGAAGCLAALQRDHRIAVLTNGDQTQQQNKCLRTVLTKFLELVSTSSSLGAAKPHPTAFIMSARRLDVDPGDVVYVGDRLDVDARAARDAGMRGVWLDRTDSEHQLDDVEVIRSLVELEDLL